MCTKVASNVPRVTGSPARIRSSARVTRPSGRKKLEADWTLAPAFSATTRPWMSMTGEPEEPPEVPEAAWI
jgi:hypothetical protein